MDEVQRIVTDALLARHKDKLSWEDASITAFDVLAALAAAGKVIEDDWWRVGDEMPPRHKGVWRVYREGLGHFDATACYGLHRPWWVPQRPAEGPGCQGDPIDMLNDDMWRKSVAPLPAPPEEKWRRLVQGRN